MKPKRKLALFGVAVAIVGGIVYAFTPRAIPVETARVTRGSLEVTVRDDGRGLPSSAQDGLGLQSIRERCRMLGARLDVVTAPDGGTSLKVRLPIEAVEDADA